MNETVKEAKLNWRGPSGEEYLITVSYRGLGDGTTTLRLLNCTPTPVGIDRAEIWSQDFRFWVCKTLISLNLVEENGRIKE